MHDNYKTLIEKLIPDVTERESFFACYHELLPRSIKIIEHKIGISEFINYTKSIGWKLTPPPFIESNDSWYITRDDDLLALGKHRLHTAGLLYIQEVAASLATNSLTIEDGDIILDMCAAPGGKSTQIADKLLISQNPGLVISNEVSGSRIVALQSNLNRTGSYNTAVTQLDGEQFGKLLPAFFDKVLVDAPCSGEGTGFKSDDATKWRREETVKDIARLQQKLLSSAIEACKPGGEIVYATCTLNPWENEYVVVQALQEYMGVITLEPVEIKGKSPGLTHRENDTLLNHEDAMKVSRFRPHRQHTGGFFIAKFRKLGSLETATTKKDKKNNSSFDLSDKLQTKVAKVLSEEYGITIDPKKHFFVSTDKQIYLTSPAYKLIHDKMYVQKTGIPILKRFNEQEFHPLHALGNCLGEGATQNIIILDDEQCQKYSEGFDITTNTIVTTPHKYAILQRQGKGFSVGKVVGDTLKNKFAK